MLCVSTRSRAGRSGPTYSVAAAFRIVVCLMIAVALPAQAVSASAERLWNAPHSHANGATDGAPNSATQAAVSQVRHVNEHFPMQRLRDIAEGRIPGEESARARANAEMTQLQAHAQQHHAGTPHHHDKNVRDVVYVADDGGDAPAVPERTGTHAHDGFTPAMTGTRVQPVFRPVHAAMALATASRMSHRSGPGERPPR